MLDNYSTAVNQEVKNKLIVALDVDTLEEAVSLVEKLHPYVGVFKVGMQLYNSLGPEILQAIHAKGGTIFSDLKFHDIPNTVGQAGKIMTRHKVFMFNVHTAGGSEMMQKAAEAAQAEAEKLGIKRPLVIGVTVLTSMDNQTLKDEVGVGKSLEEQVVHLAKLAKDSGLDGVVASPREIKAIREACGIDFHLVIPGIRPAWAASNDQKRIMTPKEAIQAGADYIVVGRPITSAADPIEAAKKILVEIEEGLVNA